ncbi:hypothetical protein Ferp_0505 [Ferroglobus placidus DSM 10642]|uniref:Uncharacterized protein n=1 Tax=Ferroglobus placidus (strain DSM 10642 / AEDII12DO) TaxID=589924 RepID=D3S346_FERPA|nr:hypothetical protein [Ferroglobus placidus]ADC64679.1 hypothetical protein Ferp_0505 [Ferroglobus placidus DSM 10642]
MDELFFEVCFGCWGLSPAPRTIICHWDGDHIPADMSIRLYAPFFPPNKYKKYTRNFTKIDFRNTRDNVISTGSLRIYVLPVTDRDVREIAGVEHRFHSSSKSAVPLLLLVSESGNECAVKAYLYIDDLDADDFEVLEKLVDHYQSVYKNFAVIVPVYLGTNAHKSRYPTELRELSIGFVGKMAERGIDVYIIPHAEGVTGPFITSRLPQVDVDKLHVLPRIYQPACREVKGH